MVSYGYDPALGDDDCHTAPYNRYVLAIPGMPQSPSTKLCVRFTPEQIEWMNSKTKAFYTKSDLLRDLVDFTMGPKQDWVDLERSRNDA